MLELVRTIGHLYSAGTQDWGSLHPVIVHLPVGLLFIAPIFIILGLCCQKYVRLFYVSACVCMIVGTAFLLMAYSTGEAAAEALHPQKFFVSTLESHDLLAGQSRTIFSIFTLFFLGYLFGLKNVEEKLKYQTHVILILVYLAGYGYGLLVLLNTAHMGGKLVHDHGIHSKIYSK